MISTYFTRARSVFDQNAYAAWTLFSQIVTSAVNFLVSIVIIRAFGLETFGQFSIAFMVLMISTNFLNTMVLTPLSVIAPRIASARRPAYFGLLVLIVSGFSLLMGTVILVGFLAIGTWFDVAWAREIAPVLFVANTLVCLFEFIRRYHLSFTSAERPFLMELLRQGLKLVLVCAAAFAFPGIASLAVIIGLLGVAALAGLLPGLSGLPAIDWRAARSDAARAEHLNYMRWTAPGTLFEMVHANLPLFIGAPLLGESAIGLVRAVYQIANILVLPLQALLKFGPVLAGRAYSERGLPGLTAFIRRSTAISVLGVAALTLAPILLFGLFETVVLGGPTEGAFALFLGNCAVNLILAIRINLSIQMYCLNRTSVIMVGDMLAAVSSVILPFVLIPPLSVLALPAINAVSLLLISGVMLVALARGGSSGPEAR